MVAHHLESKKDRKRRRNQLNVFAAELERFRRDADAEIERWRQYHRWDPEITLGYATWLDGTGLVTVGNNAELVREYGDSADFLEARRWFSKAISRASGRDQFPEIDDSSFAW